MARGRSAELGAEAFLAKLDEGKSALEYGNKQAIFSQGEAADCVFYLKNGKVKITVVSKQGKEAVISILQQGQFFGESCLVAGHSLRVSTATSIGRSKALRFSRETMNLLLHKRPDFAEFFVSHILARTIRVEADLVDQLFNSSEKRLARLLLLLANFGKDDKSELVIPKISQETLAQMVGASRSRVSSFMNKFRKMGLIEYNGGLRVHSSLFRIVLHD
jgi:CRP/FNR family transcriptional regulator, cyclic AMP receptor protein